MALISVLERTHCGPILASVAIEWVGPNEEAQWLLTS